MPCNCSGGGGNRTIVLTDDGKRGEVVGWSVTLPTGQVIGTVEAPLMNYPEARSIIRQNMGGTARRLVRELPSKSS